MCKKLKSLKIYVCIKTLSLFIKKELCRDWCEQLRMIVSHFLSDPFSHLRKVNVTFSFNFCVYNALSLLLWFMFFVFSFSTIGMNDDVKQMETWDLTPDLVGSFTKKCWFDLCHRKNEGWVGFVTFFCQLRVAKSWGFKVRDWAGRLFEELWPRFEIMLSFYFKGIAFEMNQTHLELNLKDFFLEMS